MKVYALVGKSGTGKSYQAMNLCREYGIEGIVDDGLFIHENKVAAGISAKRQTTKIGAIKTALFTEEEHRNSVADAIGKAGIGSLLILGTSRGMAEKICSRLGLPPVEKMIDIETITTEGERDTAYRQRHEMGKHVIPAPTFQIKRQFSGYFLDPLRIFRGWSRDVAEKSVVRPTYSYLGDYVISGKVIFDIIQHIGEKTDGIAAILRVDTENTAAGVEITVLAFCRYGSRIPETARRLQRNVIREVEAMTAFNIDAVNVEVRGLK